MLSRPLLMGVFAVLAGSRFPPADQFRVAAHYSKREARIRMRDGVQLFTIIYELKTAPSGIHF
jgi:predicted acyl esterase